jgi:hypothetical protein
MRRQTSHPSQAQSQSRCVMVVCVDCDQYTEIYVSDPAAIDRDSVLCDHCRREREANR